jgi:hypothetical protein
MQCCCLMIATRLLFIGINMKLQVLFEYWPDRGVICCHDMDMSSDRTMLMVIVADLLVGL